MKNSNRWERYLLGAIVGLALGFMSSMLSAGVQHDIIPLPEPLRSSPDAEQVARDIRRIQESLDSESPSSHEPLRESSAAIGEGHQESGHDRAINTSELENRVIPNISDPVLSDILNVYSEFGQIEDFKARAGPAPVLPIGMPLDQFLEWRNRTPVEDWPAENTESARGRLAVIAANTPNPLKHGHFQVVAYSASGLLDVSVGGLQSRFNIAPDTLASLVCAYAGADERDLRPETMDVIRQIAADTIERYEATRRDLFLHLQAYVADPAASGESSENAVGFYAGREGYRLWHRGDDPVLDNLLDERDDAEKETWQKTIDALSGR